MSQYLPVPPVVKTNKKDYIEVIRSFIPIDPDADLKTYTIVELPPYEHNIGMIGILMADIIRNFALAYTESGFGQQQELNPDDVADRIKKMLDDEWENPTSPVFRKDMGT